MRFLLMLALVMALAVGVAQADVVFSQVYGGGGSTNPEASFKRDFVELFNASGVPVDISGWYLTYGAATGVWGGGGGNLYFRIPEDTVMPACSYLMIACGATSTGGADLPYWDFEHTWFSMAAANGKIALFTDDSNIGLQCSDPAFNWGVVVDLVGYGSANCWEGSGATPATSINTAAIRKDGGMLDTDDNATDFVVETTQWPRWSQSPLNPGCTVTAETINWGTLKGQFR